MLKHKALEEIMFKSLYAQIPAYLLKVFKKYF